MIDWSIVPNKFNFVGIDYDGDVYCFEEMPKLFNGIWDKGGDVKRMEIILPESSEPKLYSRYSGLITTSTLDTSEVKFKKLHSKAKTPSRAYDGDAGWDLFPVSISREDGRVKYKFGIAFEIPEGKVGCIFPRSSVYKTDLTLANCVGVIDSGYRGEVSAIFRSTGGKEYNLEGEAVAQIVFFDLPKVTLTEVDTLSDSQRGEGGFGSSTKK